MGCINACSPECFVVFFKVGMQTTDNLLACQYHDLKMKFDNCVSLLDMLIRTDMPTYNRVVSWNAGLDGAASVSPHVEPSVIEEQVSFPAQHCALPRFPAHCFIYLEDILILTHPASAG